MDAHHDYSSDTLAWHAAGASTIDPSGLLYAVVVCKRCGGHALSGIGERLPVVCTPTPEWLRACHS